MAGVGMWSFQKHGLIKLLNSRKVDKSLKRRFSEIITNCFQTSFIEILKHFPRMAHFWTSLVGCTTSFHRGLNKLSLVWVKLFLKTLKIVTVKDRTHANRPPFYHVTAIPIVHMTNRDFFFLNLTIVTWKNPQNW